MSARSLAARHPSFHPRKHARRFLRQNSEAELNQLGSRLYRTNRLSDAIAIFKLNVEQFRKSADAYAKDGQKQLALENYRKCLELDPKNQHAADQIKQLEQK